MGYETVEGGTSQLTFFGHILYSSAQPSSPLGQMSDIGQSGGLMQHGIGAWD